MGEIADMMLDGTLCEWCGAYLDEAVGHTRLCSGCQLQKRKINKAKKKQKLRELPRKRGRKK